jgi:hypothetical protein
MLSRRSMILGSLSSLTLLSTGLAHADGTDSFQVVVHPKLKLQDINVQELARVFSGRRRDWSSSTPVQLVLLPSGSPEMSWLCKQLKVPEHLLRRFIYQRVYRAQLRKPIEVNTSEEALMVVKSTPGAVAPLLLSKVLQTRLNELQQREEVSLVELSS